MVGRASEQASAASDASGALEMYQDVDRRYTFPLSAFGRFPGKSYSNNVPSYSRKLSFWTRFPFYANTRFFFEVFRPKTLPKRLQSDVEVEARFWYDSGGLLASFWSQLGFSNRAKSEENRGQEAFHLGLHFLIDVCSILDRFLKDFRSQNGFNLASKSIKNQR